MRDNQEVIFMTEQRDTFLKSLHDLRVVGVIDGAGKVKKLKGRRKTIRYKVENINGQLKETRYE